jgi:ribulose-5-phosphate 4-epimerase/fuculose-1-phosphate aldolase
MPYTRPGEAASGDLIRELGGRYAAVLLANHGPIVTGKDLSSALFAAEELEETAKLLVMLRSMPCRMLTSEQVADLRRVFGT